MTSAESNASVFRRVYWYSVPPPNERMVCTIQIPRGGPIGEAGAEANRICTRSPTWTTPPGGAGRAIAGASIVNWRRATPGARVGYRRLPGVVAPPEGLIHVEVRPRRNRGYARRVTGDDHVIRDPSKVHVLPNAGTVQQPQKDGAIRLVSAEVLIRRERLEPRVAIGCRRGQH